MHSPEVATLANVYRDSDALSNADYLAERHARFYQHLQTTVHGKNSVRD